MDREAGKHLSDVSEHLCQQEGRPAESRPEQMAVKSELYDAHTNICLTLSDILDALPFYVLLIDENHRILRANSAVRAQLRLEPEAIIGQYCPKAIHGLNKPIDDCPLEEAAERNQAVEREILDSGSGRWIRSAIYPTRGTTTDGRRIFFHMVIDVTDHKLAQEQLRASHEQLRNLSLHLESAREEERTNMAREIHDELGQLLTGLKMDMSWMSKRLDRVEGSLVEKARAMDQLIDEAIQAVKRISAELRPGMLDHLGLAAAIEWQAQELEKRTAIKFEFRANPEEITLDPSRSTTLFRICQESLTNVIRHANATRVKITLKEEPDRIALRISDNGKGIEKEQLSDLKAFGLIGMRERARFWGGEVLITGTPGKGTVVAVSIPLLNGENLNAENPDCR